MISNRPSVLELSSSPDILEAELIETITHHVMDRFYIKNKNGVKTNGKIFAGACLIILILITIFLLIMLFLHKKKCKRYMFRKKYLHQRA